MNDQTKKTEDRELSLKEIGHFFKRKSLATIYNWRDQGILPEFHYDPSGHPFLYLSECEEVKRNRDGRRRFRK